MSCFRFFGQDFENLGPDWYKARGGVPSSRKGGAEEFGYLSIDSQWTQGTLL